MAPRQDDDVVFRELDRAREFFGTFVEMLELPEVLELRQPDPPGAFRWAPATDRPVLSLSDAPIRLPSA